MHLEKYTKHVILYYYISQWCRSVFSIGGGIITRIFQFLPKFRVKGWGVVGGGWGPAGPGEFLAPRVKMASTEVAEVLLAGVHKAATVVMD